VAAQAGRRVRGLGAGGSASLILYDVSTLYFETDAGDGFREPDSPRNAGWSRRSPSGCSPTRRVPVDGGRVRGNTAETTTMLPTIQAFMKAHQLRDVTVVADAAWCRRSNQKAIEAAGCRSSFGARIPEVPYVVDQWRRQHRARTSKTGRYLSNRGRPQALTSGGPGHLLQYKADRPGARYAASTNRSPRPRRRSRQDRGQAQPVRAADRCDEERQPGVEAKARALAG